MLSQSRDKPTNRVQAIRSKFENLSCESSRTHLNKQGYSYDHNCCNKDKENINNHESLEERLGHAESSQSNSSIMSNEGYLHNSDIEKDTQQALDFKKTLSRQSSDPGKKLHRRHAFRCDRSKIIGPQRHGSWNGRSETNKFSCKSDKKLSKDRLEKLSNVIENQMKKENFVFNKESENIVGEVMEVTEANTPLNSIPDSDVPSHILEQYAKVIKPRSVDIEKQDGMIDSGVSSETENLEDDKSLKIKQIIGQFEKTDDTNLDSMNDLCASTETMRLERKNPHLVLTSTLKKALKQPLPPGPPPKKPPRTFTTSPLLEKPNKQKKDTRKMLEKLELVLQKREGRSSIRNNYDIAEENESLSSDGSENKDLKKISSVSKVQKKEMHYLCTEILDIANKTLPLPPNPLNCFKSLNCAIANNSTLSLTYAQINANRRSSRFCSCSSENLAAVSDRVSTFLEHKCVKCQLNGQKDTSFKCHLKCKCNGETSQFFIDKEHIYDEPFTSEYGVMLRRSHYGTLNQSKSLEDLRSKEIEKIYDIPCDISRPATPQADNSESDHEDCNLTNSLENTSNSNKIVETKRNRASSLNLERQKRNSYETEPSIHHLKSIFENNIDIKTQDSGPKKELDLKLNFEQLRKNFESDNPENAIRKSFKNNNENSSIETENSKVSALKPPMRPKPMFLKNNSKSTENLLEPKTNFEKGTKFSSAERKYRRERDSKTGRLSLPERNAQLDMDKENLNRLMNELYETVVACSMQPAPPFPSEDSVKLSRSLTEKRKNYVRRVSSRVNYAETKNLRKPRHQTSICYYKPENDEIVNNYSTFRSWKSFRTSQNNISKMEGDLTDSKIELDNIDNKSIDEKTGCVDIELPFEPRERALFNVCLLVGLNHMTGQAYVKSVFPKQVQVPDHIENLVFPETLCSSTGEITISAQSAESQCYSMVLTDERGERSYGYCRRVVPEGATVCLPLCYCLIAKFRAPGFYYKILEEIESHHGSSEVEINTILQQLFESDFPDPGEELVVTYHPPETSWRNSVNYENARFDTNLQSVDTEFQSFDTNSQGFDTNSQSLDTNSHLERNSENLDRMCQNLDKNLQNSNRMSQNLDRMSHFDRNIQNSNRNSQNFDENSPNLNRNSHISNSYKNLDKNSQNLDKKCQNYNRNSNNFEKCKTLPNMRKSDISDVQSDLKSASGQLCDLQNNNNARILLDVEGPKVKSIKRPLEPRVDEGSLPALVEALGAGLAVKVFGSLLLERKVLVCGDRLGLVSSCMEALQLSLYPFVWQQPLISCVPAQIQRDVVEAPLPILAGMLAQPSQHNYQPLEEGMLIDLTHPSKVLHYQGDESTILPAQSYRTLKTALQGGARRGERGATANLVIAEAFLRFFVDILGDFWQYFSLGEVKEGQFGKAGVVFDTASFIKNAPSKQNQYFLEWFTETAMFNHFIQNMSILYRKSIDNDRKSSENDNLNLIDAPLPDFYNLFEDRLRNRTKIDANKFDKSNYKNAMNKRMKLLKLRLKELVA